MRPNTTLLNHIERNGFTHFFRPRNGTLFLLRPAQHPSYPGCWAEQVVMRRPGEDWFVNADILIWDGDDLNGKRDKVRPLDPQGRGWWHILDPLTPAERMDRVELYHRRGFITDWQLWDVLGYFGGPLSGAEAIQVYKRLGYKPLAGYPLQKE